MSRPLPWFWIALAALLLLAPSPAGRVLLDLIGGLTLTLLLLPLVLGAAGFVAWQVLPRRARTCAVCGFRAIALDHCPACGAPYRGFPDAGSASADLDASTATIDVEVIDES
ncbi:MAG: hypothetical protein ACK5GZ_10700 [Cyanobium sp.]|jgi:hypothetical protein